MRILVPALQGFQTYWIDTHLVPLFFGFPEDPRIPGGPRCSKHHEIHQLSNPFFEMVPKTCQGSLFVPALEQSCEGTLNSKVP